MKSEESRKLEFVESNGYVLFENEIGCIVYKGIKNGLGGYNELSYKAIVNHPNKTIVIREANEDINALFPGYNQMLTSDIFTRVRLELKNDAYEHYKKQIEPLVAEKKPSIEKLISEVKSEFVNFKSPAHASHFSSYFGTKEEFLNFSIENSLRKSLNHRFDEFESGKYLTDNCNIERAYLCQFKNGKDDILKDFIRLTDSKFSTLLNWTFLELEISTAYQHLQDEAQFLREVWELVNSSKKDCDCKVTLFDKEYTVKKTKSCANYFTVDENQNICIMTIKGIKPLVDFFKKSK